MRLHDGVLFFPVTPFDDAGAVAPDVLAKHVADGMAHRPGGVFAACGTGELHALDLPEHELTVRAAREVVDGRVPVVAGAGGPLALAREQARQAQRAGADGLLLLPPYLVGGPQQGIVDYVTDVAAASELPIVLYQRGQVRFDVDALRTLAAHPRVVGLKDGAGDFDLLQRQLLALRADLGDGLGSDFALFNGLPTAEFTMPAYRGIGMTRWSSAAFAFLPEVANAFHDAHVGGDVDRERELLTRFYAPLVRLRDQVPGYAVSLVKAGVRLRGLDVGGVRAPLVDPSPQHLAELESLVAVGLELAE
ncbi:5-dehydro-4-deoxyglucarate dehydratase [Egicoccus sp. AB-alg6-2]|uniref:5-dehydro-4-deoxyglucarate dehydratase n=1 Tax=Egicoccus sp. AB-alg6-2 TaxID=3242692 RepID=UPI00359EAD8C